MATMAQPPLAHSVGDEHFFLRAAFIMAAIIVAGFSFQLAMGRSTFASPVRVHVHAVLFMGWVAIYLARSGRKSLPPSVPAAFDPLRSLAA